MSHNPNLPNLRYILLKEYDYVEKELIVSCFSWKKKNG